MEEDVDDVPAVCDKCGSTGGRRGFSNLKGLRMHQIRYCVPQKYWTCSCTQAFINWTDLIEHQKQEGCKGQYAYSTIEDTHTQICNPPPRRGVTDSRRPGGGGGGGWGGGAGGWGGGARGGWGWAGGGGGGGGGGGRGRGGGGGCRV
jgi:hypothetical protein